ncbi:MAG: App1 family protein [Pseudomonadota bacterium]|nr:App1 family protein [Pseudomonadota bacterium]
MPSTWIFQKKAPSDRDLYRHWARGGAAFHYVSASPWHLYPWLSRFTERYGFPLGVFRLFVYRLTDESLLDLFSSPMEKKYRVLEGIFADFPQRRFILVGDSGEADPEVSSALARSYGHQVEKIFVRVVPNSDLSEQQLKQAFYGVDKRKWQLFRHPAEIERSCLGYRLR